MGTTEFLKTRAHEVETALEFYLATWENVPPKLDEAIRYSLFAGGKRLRPALVLEATRVVGGDETNAMPAACALEMIHTYSLVHDDLPAMDNDDLRRGKPTSHKKYDEGTAILVGDALLTMAFDIAAQSRNIQVITEIAQAAGINGMVGGQFQDLASEGKPIGLEELKHLHACKTGALISISLKIGSILGGANPDQQKALLNYGQYIGLAFQIADDILDIEGDQAALGKPIGSDQENNKSTYPALLGLSKAKIMATDAALQATTQLEIFGSEADTLCQLATYIIERKH
jgi:geranylgeranyl diphosphate synthase, type II